MIIHSYTYNNLIDHHILLLSPSYLLLLLPIIAYHTVVTFLGYDLVVSFAAYCIFFITLLFFFTISQCHNLPKKIFPSRSSTLQTISNGSATYG